MKIVESGYKLDLHIHSCYSRVKDGSKVAFNTIDNINILVQKLAENEVQLCAITDHDAFNFDIYKELKAYEQMPDFPIVKVFPGIEFSVEFKGDFSPAVIHVIAIFDDQDDVKIRRISTVLNNESGRPKYDREMAFSEEAFLSILREIDIDTILIAHQKNSITSSSKKNVMLIPLAIISLKSLLKQNISKLLNLRTNVMKFLIKPFFLNRKKKKIFVLLLAQIVMIGEFIPRKQGQIPLNLYIHM